MRSGASFDSWRAETGTGVVWMDTRQALWPCRLTAWWSCHPMLKGYLLSKSPGARDFHWHNPGKETEKWEGLSHSELIFIEVNFKEEKLWTLLWALLIFVECYEEESLCKCLVLPFTETADDMLLLEWANVLPTRLLRVRSGGGLLHSAYFYKGWSALKNFAGELQQNDQTNFIPLHQRRC